jgi:hypothetical protein
MSRKSKLPEISDRLESVKVADIDARAAALAVLRDMAEHDIEYLLRHISRLETALRGAMSELREGGYGDPSYGPFWGGDPRHFQPDPDCTTEDEQRRHREACEAADAEERARNLGSDCRWTNPAIKVDPNGDTIGKVFGIGGGFGIGTNTQPDQAANMDRWRMALQDFTPPEQMPLAIQ